MKCTTWKVVSGPAALTVFATVVLCQSAGPPPVITGNAKVDRLLSQMTLEEKINLLHGGAEASPSGVGQAGAWPGLPRLNIPSLRLSDGPPGISVQIWSTGMTATMGLAATWSREDARKNGVVIGRDAKSLGQDVVLEPFINIVRDFEFGRAYNTFGEDPFLTGQVAAAQIQGTQSEGVMSQAKHFIGYDGANDVYIDPQTLREIYMAPFVDASNAGVSSIMCSYNKINGLQACDNNELQNIVFRGEEGFRGFSTSDWGATHGTLNIANGLDLEMPSGSFTAAVPASGGGRRGGGEPGNAPGAPPGGSGVAAGVPPGPGGVPAAPGGVPPGPGGGAPGGRGGVSAGASGMPAAPGAVPAGSGGGMPGGPGGVPPGPGGMPPGGRGGGGMPEEQGPPGRGGRGGGRGGRGGDPPAYGMLKAVQDGLIREAQIDLALGRVLMQMDRFGLLDRAPKHNITEIDYASNAPVLQKTAEDAATLLKNQDNVLPLAAADLDSTAFIGPTGGILVSIGMSGEKAMGLPDHQAGPVPSIEKITGRKVKYAVANDFDGTPIPASAYTNLERTNTANSQTQTDAELNFTTSSGKALPPGTSYTWKGTLNVPGDGAYMLAFQTRGTTGQVELDGNRVLGGGGGRGFGGGGRGAQGGPPLASLPGLKGQHPISGNIVPTADHLNNQRARVELKAGPHQLTVSTTGEQNSFPVQVRLAWVTPQQEKANREAALALARQSKKAVVFAWARQSPSPFALPGGQDDLISDIAAVNPNTIVVLNTTLPVAMPWLDKVKGVLEMWYPGDEGGPATANVLLGKANPAGRLPITWPRELRQMVAQDPQRHPERTNGGIDGKTTYSEGIFVGYRWFDQQDVKPTFPFGHGLSYTTFQYSGLKVSPAKDGGLDVSFAVKNAGKAAGDEVPQVYLGAPRSAPQGAQFAVRALVQFDRVGIPPGQSKTVTLHVEPRRFEYWSTAAGRWEIARGSRTVYVGASSRDLRLQTDVAIGQ
ncbi:MAG: beta-glucosidase family protein [Bryobacteraceae bacterium]